MLTSTVQSCTTQPPGRGALRARSTRPEAFFTRRRCYPMARSWSLGDSIAPRLTAQNSMTQQRGLGFLLAISMKPAILTRLHCCLTARSWLPEDITTMTLAKSKIELSFMIRPPESGALPAAFIKGALITQLRYFQMAGSW